MMKTPTKLFNSIWERIFAGSSQAKKDGLQSNIPDILLRMQLLSGAIDRHELARVIGRSEEEVENWQNLNESLYSASFALADQNNVPVSWVITGELSHFTEAMEMPPNSNGVFQLKNGITLITRVAVIEGFYQQFNQFRHRGLISLTEKCTSEDISRLGLLFYQQVLKDLIQMNHKR